MQRRMDENYSIIAPGSAKTRGRSRKADTVLLPGEITALGVVAPTSDVKCRKPKLSVNGTQQSGDANETMIGQRVYGVVDGSFDAGYLVTVRVGDSETVFRGVVFGPGLSIPLAKTDDVAPQVKTTLRDTVSSLVPLVASHSPVTFVEPLLNNQITKPTQPQEPTIQSVQELGSEGFGTLVQTSNLASPEFASRPDPCGVEAQITLSDGS